MVSCWLKARFRAGRCFTSRIREGTVTKELTVNLVELQEVCTSMISKDLDPPFKEVFFSSEADFIVVYEAMGKRRRSMRLARPPLKVHIAPIGWKEYPRIPSNKEMKVMSQAVMDALKLQKRFTQAVSIKDGREQLFQGSRWGVREIQWSNVAQTEMFK